MQRDKVFENCTFEEKHSVIEVLFSESVEPSEIYPWKFKQYDESYLNSSDFCTWSDLFKSDLESVSDKQSMGQPTEVSTPALKSPLMRIFKEDRSVTVEEINGNFSTIHY